MLLRITVAVALVLACVTNASADEPTLLDLTIATCVGPEFNPSLDLNGMIAGLTGENCVRACRTAERGCKAVVRAVDKCGVSFLRAAAKTRIEVCRGLGGTSRECRVIKDDVKLDIAWWKVAGKVEQADCDADTQTLCMNRCQPLTRRGSPIPITPPEEEGEAGASLSLYEDLVPAGQYDFLEGGVEGLLTGFIPSSQYLGGALLVTESTQGQVRGTIVAYPIPSRESYLISINPEELEQAESVNEFLD